MADRTFDNLDQALIAIAERTEKNATLHMRRLALIIDRNVVLATPVDTGRARSNWIVSVVASTDEVREPFAPTKGGGIGESSNAQGAIRQAENAVRHAKPGQTIFINNNLPYIAELNNGTSAQAPRGFVRTSVLIGVSWLKGQKFVT